VRTLHEIVWDIVGEGAGGKQAELIAGAGLPVEPTARTAVEQAELAVEALPGGPDRAAAATFLVGLVAGIRWERERRHR
jgi:hypothetical protein